MVTHNNFDAGLPENENSDTGNFIVPGLLYTTQALRNLNVELAKAYDIHRIAELVKEFCSELWTWDSFLLSMRRSKTSSAFAPVLAIDTIEGEKVICDLAKSHVQTSQSSIWIRILDGEPILLNRNRDQLEVTHRDKCFGNEDRLSASLMYAPVKVKENVIGFITVQSYAPEIYSDVDLQLLTIAADTVGPTILRYRAEQHIQEFLKLGERLNQVTDILDVARATAASSANLFHWDFFSVHLFNQKSSVLQPVLALKRSPSGPLVCDSEDLVLKDGDAFAQVLKGNGLLLESGLAEDEPDTFGPFGKQLPLMASMIMMPVRSRNKVVGLICIQNDTAASYTEDEQDILRGLAVHCGSALERAWADMDLKQSEQNYRLVVQNVNDGIVISQDDRFVFFNPRFATMLGYTPDELSAKTYLDIYSDEGLSILHERHDKRISGEIVPDRYETVFRKKDGSMLPVEANVTIIPDHNGRSATFAVVRDVSERIAAEAILRKTDEELRTLITAMTDIILVIDDEGRYLTYGAAGEHRLFTPWENLSGKTLKDIFSPEKSDYFLRLIRRSLESQEVLNIEYDFEPEPGNLHWYNATISPLSSNTILLVARDITERRNSEEELFRSNARYEALLDGSEDYIFVLDKDLRFIHVNSAIEKRYNAKSEDRIGKHLLAIYKGEPPEYVSKIQEVFKTGKPVMYDDDAVVGGRLICTETVVSPVFDRDGKVETVLGVSRDVTSRRLSELALKRSEQRYALAVRGANDGIWDWNLETDKLYLSPRWWAIVGENDELQPPDHDVETWLSRVHYGDLLSLREKILDHINGATSHLEDEHRILHADGNYRWVLCRGICVRDSNGNALQMAGSLSDITDRKSTEEKLHYSATHDALTGLPNRACFLDFLEKTMARTRRLDPEQHHFAVLFLDLDRFKVINDSLGHLAGDELIISMARRLEASVRPGDTVARMGGDEFTILLEGLSQNADAIRVAERTIRELSAPTVVAGVTVQTTVSVGIAYDKAEYRNPNELLRDADTAMYRAKAAGRNQYQVFDQEMHAHAMKALHWEADLRRAVAQQQFELHYQPMYSLITRQLVGFEALIRWNHPENGLTYPGMFIPLAEDTGLIIPMGWWILDQAAQATVKWNAQRSLGDQLSVSVNLSPRQLHQMGADNRINFLIKNAGALPENIIIEITESVLMENSHQVSDTLQVLRQMGIRIDLDDFGTGYSSLSYLQRYPIDRLKIDRSFVNDLDASGKGRKIVEAMLGLAQGLGLEVTAEGVETRGQFDALSKMGCDWVQGYFFSKPVTFEDTWKIISERSSLDNLAPANV